MAQQPNQQSQQQQSQQQSQQQPQTPKLGRATVARGHTIIVPHPTQFRTVGHMEDGKPIRRALVQTFGPGHEVELAEDEIASFRRSGHLVDPSLTPHPIDTGPSFAEQQAART